MLIEVTELRFSYKKAKSVLDGISCSFSGGINIVLGSNGAGKSTLMKLLATELKPRSGVIRYDGKTVERKNRPTIVSRLGWVPQHNAVDTSQTVRDLVQTAAWLHGYSRSEARRAACEAIALVHLSDNEGDRFSSLSGGMQRRAMVAVGIAHRPDVLILDEPTSGLDPNHRASLLNIIRRLSEKTSVIMSTHISSDIEPTDRVLFLDSGHIVVDVRSEELERKYGSIDAAFGQLTAGVI